MSDGRTRTVSSRVPEGNTTVATPQRKPADNPGNQDPWYAESAIYDQQQAEEDAAAVLWLTNGEPPKAFVKSFLPVGPRATRRGLASREELRPVVDADRRPTRAESLGECRHRT